MYTVLQGQTIGDICINQLGSLDYLNDLLTENGFLTWTPMLNAGDQLSIPVIANVNLNNIRQFQQYPVNNASAPNVYTQIASIFALVS